MKENKGRKEERNENMKNLGKDIWREIGKKIVERDGKEKGEGNWRTFWNLTLVNKEFKNKIFDENFFKRAWEEKYGDEIKRNGLQKHENTWKKTYFDSLKILTRMKRYGFTYTEGNYLKQDTLFPYIYPSDAIKNSIWINEFSILKHFVDIGIKPFYHHNYSEFIYKIIYLYVTYIHDEKYKKFRWQTYIKMIDYLLEEGQGKSLGFENDTLWIAAREKCLDIVKHVAEKYPSTILSSGGEALRMACVSGDLAIVKYLVLTRDVSIVSYKGQNSYFLNLAISNKHTHIVEFLKSC